MSSDKASPKRMVVYPWPDGVVVVERPPRDPVMFARWIERRPDESPGDRRRRVFDATGLVPPYPPRRTA